MDDYNYLFKIIIVGDVNVGKSSLLLQFTESRYKNDYDATIGVEFGSKLLSMGDQKIKVQVWDTVGEKAGQESYRSIIRSYYKGCVGVVLVYDITNPTSFDNIETWMEELHEHSSSKPEIILIGNKSDLPNRFVKSENAEQEALRHGVEFIETSALTGKNVEYAFTRLCELVYQKIKSGEINPLDKEYGIKIGGQSLSILNNENLTPLLGDGSNRKSKGCCC